MVLVLLLGMQQQAQTQAKFLKTGVSAGYYSWADKELVQAIYGSGDISTSFEVGIEIWNEKFELRVEWGFLTDMGEMTISKEETKLNIKALTLGARFLILHIEKLKPYIGAGFVSYKYTETPPERFQPYSGKTEGGFHAEIGTYLDALKDLLYLDFNVRYVKADSEPFNDLLKFGGIRAGVGFGLRF